MPLEIRKCKICKTEFTFLNCPSANLFPNLKRGSYCSNACKITSQRKKDLTSVCKFCSKIFKNTMSGIKFGKRRFCSRKCYWRFLKGKPPTIVFPKGNIPWNKGLKGFMGGAKNANWKGGVTKINEKIRKSIEYKNWRTSVFQRDNYTCIWCMQKGGKLNADHIKPQSLYPELRFSLENGRTLCISCHRKTDTWGGETKFKIKCTK